MLKSATHEERVRLELGPNTFSNWTVVTSYKFNLPDCLDHTLKNRLEQLNCQNIVVEYESESDTYSDGYDTDDRVFSYDTFDCE